MDRKSEPERMPDFFNKRAGTYDDHMKNNIKNFDLFYSKVSEPIPKTKDKIKVLDLGCGTGIELEFLFAKAPNAQVTGIDISEEMLKNLQEKYYDKREQIKMIGDSYLETKFKENEYDYIISVMTLHHLEYDKKKSFYQKLRMALKNNGQYIEGDFVVSRKEEERFLLRYKEIISQKKETGEGLHHIDLPFTLKRQKQLFSESGYKDFHLIFQAEEAAIYVVRR